MPLQDTCRSSISAKPKITSIRRPDKYAALALRNTAAIIQPGQKLIIIDVVMPVSPMKGQTMSESILTDMVSQDPHSTTSTVERTLRSSDMEMMVQFNALEREARDWEDLIKEADPRMRIQNIRKPDGSANSIIEIEFEKSGC